MVADDPRTRRPLADWILIGLFGLLAGWAVWSYIHAGVVYAFVTAATDNERSLEVIRAAVESAGVFAPAVYVAAVVLEVLIAPLPGTLLYAPGGAIFGGFLGGSLSLAGNVIGASGAAWLASRFGPRILGHSERPRLESIAARVRRRGIVVVALLRVNPLTSSDLVSYAAGLVGVRVWRVALGTFLGMAPLCYAQAYASEWILRAVPGSGLLVVTFGVVYLVVIIWLLARPSARTAVDPAASESERTRI